MEGIDRARPVSYTHLLEYFNVNIYSSSLLNDERLLSPLAKNGQKYYKYRIDSVMGDPNNLDYRVRFIPRTKSDQLVGGYMAVSYTHLATQL